jgi:hypothetical protein
MHPWQKLASPARPVLASNVQPVSRSRLAAFPAPALPDRSALPFFARAPIVVLGLLVAGLGAADGPRAEEPPRGFVALFDGKTFEGWEGNLDAFRIEDGAIVGGNLETPIPRNEFLCTKGEYADFELRLKFMLKGKGANGGVQLRSRRIPNHHEMIGYQADMGEGWWGCLYDESRRNRVLAGPPEEERSGLVRMDDWNDYRILCEGRRVRLWVNGHATVDYTEPDESLEQNGLIGLQIHSGPPTEAWYKDLLLREIPSPSTTE